MGISKSRTTPYHPQCNGLVERINICQMLRTLAEVYKSKDIEGEVNKLVYAYNCSKHSVRSHWFQSILFDVTLVCQLTPYLKKTWKKPVRLRKKWKTRMKQAFENAAKHTGDIRGKRRDVHNLSATT